MLPHTPTINYELRTLKETQQLAKTIARVILPNFVIALNGDLGAGKTTLVREILYSMGITGSVKSPTFTYVEPYRHNNIDILHFDLYRFSDSEEWFELGFDDYFINDHICFIEWAKKADGLIPPIDWKISMATDGENHSCKITAYTEKGQECLKKLIAIDASLSN